MTCRSRAVTCAARSGPKYVPVTFPTAAQLSANSANIRRGDVLFVLGASTWSLTSSLSPALQIGSDSPTLASLPLCPDCLRDAQKLLPN